VSEPFRHSLRVRYNECDQLGIVFNANYLVYADLAINEFWRERLGGYRSLVESGLDVAVVQAGLRFHRPLRFDQEFTVEVRAGEPGRTSLSFEMAILCEGEKATGISMKYVCVDSSTGRPAPLPETVRAGLER
jgi:acyl-CoA thioester hydrolase